MGLEINVQICCDDCTLIETLNGEKIRSFSAASVYARSVLGWSVSQNGWYCPECTRMRIMKKTKKANETKKAEKENAIYTNRQKAIDDFMIDTGSFDTEEQAEAFIKSCITEKWLKSGAFSNRTIEILSYRYNDNLTYEEIGNKYGLTRERIRQIIKKSERIIKRRCLAILQRDSYILQNSQIY